MRQLSVLVAAASATLVCSLAHAQGVVWQENFDDGLAASRFVVNKLAAPTSNTETVAFNTNYGLINYDSYLADGVTAVPTPIPAAPGSATTIGVKLQYSGAGAHLALLPTIAGSAVTVGGDFRIEGYMWANYNGGPGDFFSTQGGSGSTEYITTGLNRTGTTGVAGIFPTGSTPALGYDFSVAMEGGSASDYRISTTDTSDDGPGAPKRNAAWPGAVTENRFNLATGDLILAPNDATGVLIGDTVDNHANSYYRAEVFPKSAGFELPGTPAKKWVQFVVEQHGRISSYTLNGKIVSILFNEQEDYSGTPQFGYADRFASVAADAGTKQFALFDNLKASTLADASQNSISGANAFAEIKTSGTYPVSSATNLTGLVFDIPSSEATQTSTVNGSGPLNFNGGYGAVLASRGTHTISAPVNFTADTAIMVGPGGAAVETADSTLLTMNNVSFSTATDVTKLGFGKLQINRLRAKSLTNNAGTVQITGAGPGSAGKITAYDTYIVASAAGATLDIGRTVLAFDYAARNSANPALSNSPLAPPTGLSLGAIFFQGFAADPGTSTPGHQVPTFTGRGIITSAPEVVGEGFYTSAYVVRLFEASLLGYTATPSQLGDTNLNVDDSTVLIGFTFKADFNFDQTVDFDDLVILAQNYNTSGKDWTKGNATADGVFGAPGTVDFDDLVILAQSYNKTIGVSSSALGSVYDASFQADWARALAIAVPEPTSLTLLGLGGLAMLRRRR